MAFCSILAKCEQEGQYFNLYSKQEKRKHPKKQVWCTTVMMHIRIAKPLSDRQLPVKFILARVDSC